MFLKVVKRLSSRQCNFKPVKFSRKRIILTCVTFLMVGFFWVYFTRVAYAAERYFVTNVNCNNTWADTDCWSATSGGAGGQVVPTASDNVHFDENSCTGSCANVALSAQSYTANFDFTRYVKTFNAGTYTVNVSGNLTLVSGMTFTYGTSTFAFVGASNQTVTSAGKSFYSFTINKNTGEVVLADNMTIRGNFTNTAGGINAGTNKITLTAAASSITAGASGITIYDLEINKNDNAAARIYNTITVTNNLTLTEGLFRGGTSGIINVQGTITVNANFGEDNDTYMSGVTIIATGGTNPQTLTGTGYLPSFYVAKTAGTEISLQNDIKILGNFNVQSGNFTHNNYKVTLDKSAGTAVNTTLTGGNVSLYDFEVNRGTSNYVTLSGTTVVTHSLTLTDGMINGATSATIEAQGNVIMADTFGGASQFNDGVITLVGSDDSQTVSTSGGSNGILPSIVINKTGAANVVTFSNDLKISGSLILTQGSPSFGTTKITFVNGVAGLDLNGGTGGLTFYDLEFAMPGAFDIDVLNLTTVTHTLTLTQGYLDAGTSGNINSLGDVVVAGTFGTSATTHDAVITFAGADAQTLKYETGGILPKIVINKTNSSDTIKASGTGPINFYEDFSINKGIFDLNGLGITTQSTSTYSCLNDGTLRLKGSEAITLGTAFDINSGNVVFNGDATYNSGLPAFGDRFYVLEFNNAAGTWILDANLQVDSILKITAGTLSQETYNIQAVGVTVGANGVWSNKSTGDIIVGTGNVVNSGNVIFKANNGCGSTDEIAITAISGTPSWSISGSGTYDMEDVSVTNQNAVTAITVYSGTNVSGNTGRWTFSASCPSVGSLTVDIVDGGGSPVASPEVLMAGVTFSFTNQTASGTFGTTDEKIRISNTTANPQWTLSIAATNGSTSYWNGPIDYDFNDPTANAGDGADADSLGGRLTVNSSGATITPQGGCSTAGLTLGNASFDEVAGANSVTILTAAGTTELDCYWDITDISLSQTIPREQPVSNYSIDMTITATAI